MDYKLVGDVFVIVLCLAAFVAAYWTGRGERRKRMSTTWKDGCSCRSEGRTRCKPCE